MKVTYYAACSKDGFIAKEDGDVSWLDELDIDMDAADYQTFFASIDGLVMGRGTYDFVFDYGKWYYEDKPCWVCTSKQLQVLEGANLLATDSVDKVIEDAKTAGLKHLWLVGGGKLASSFIDKGLLSHLSISEMPIELGSGIPLFSDHQLSKLTTKEIEKIQKKGFVQIEASLSIKK